MRMLITICAVATLLLLTGTGQAAIIWDGPDITVTQPDNSPNTVWDVSLPGDSWTRGVEGVLRTATDPDPEGWSPTGYRFAFSDIVGNPTFSYGNAANWVDLDFDGFWDALEYWVGEKIEGRPGVVHHVASDTYFDIEFSHWECCGGGGFSYVRSTAVPEPGGAIPEPGSVIIWLGLGTIGLSGWRRRRGRQKS